MHMQNLDIFWVSESFSKHLLVGLLTAPLHGIALIEFPM
jgi:hypothetical protein